METPGTINPQELERALTALVDTFRLAAIPRVSRPLFLVKPRRAARRHRCRARGLFGRPALRSVANNEE